MSQSLSASTSNKPKRLGVLISGRGSNMASILNAQKAGLLIAGEIVVVISNKAKAAGLDIAKSEGVATAVVPMRDAATGEKKPLEAFDADVVAHLRDHQVDAVVLAGYGRIISSVLLDAFPNRIVNIHPSLLPAYGGVGMVGLAVHQAVVAGKEAASGCTVHVVTETVDGGPLLGQCQVPVLPTDTADVLAERVLAQEHRLYPTVLQAWLQADFVLTAPLHLQTQQETPSVVS